ncbi:MAG: acyl-CoA dehydrogenase family protein [Deltaproteobacteria bacterium]|nr:acyl-CoA dehydrogenase family protein [Deltaproteobacteria bacterium]
MSARLALALSPRHDALEEHARSFAARAIAPREHEESDDFARSVTKELGAEGLLEAGCDLEVTAVCLLREIVASHSGLVDSMLALQGLGYGPIALMGSDAQRAEWRPRVASGHAIAAIAITEPEAGSDLGAIKTRARRDGPDWVIDGRKSFITNAGLADLYCLFARTSDDGTRGLSAFIVPADRIARSIRYELVAPHPCGEIELEGARVPADALIGGEGQGMKLAMMTLDRFRPTVGAAAIGMGQRALDEAVSRSNARSQFGQPIARFQQIGAYLADSFAELEAARLLVYRAAAARDRDEHNAGMLASAAKLLATETAQRVIDRAVQVHGGTGVRRGSVVERLYREIRALRVYEGTSEIQRVVLARALTQARSG